MARDRQVEHKKYASIRDWDRYANGFDKHVSDAFMGNGKLYITFSNHKDRIVNADIRFVLPVPR